MNPRSSNIPHLLRAIVERRNWHGQRPVQRFTAPSNRLQRLQYASSAVQRPASNAGTTQSHRVKPQLKPSPVKRSPRSEIASAIPPRENRVNTVQDSKQLAGSRDAKRRRRYLIAITYFAAITGAYIAYAYMSYKKDAERYAARSRKLDLYEDVSDRWCDASRNFDREVEDSEFFMGLRAKRKRLIRDSYGDVLEVSVGTGRNMDLYDTRPYTATEDASHGRSRKHMITSLTFNDQSAVMVKSAQKKWTEKQAEKNDIDRFRGTVHWVVGDAGDPLVIQRPPGGYDTIVQSMGICSMPDPVGFLQRLNALCCQPGESPKNAPSLRMQAEEVSDSRGGKIFLLEHGRSYYSWLNNLLDTGAPMHADRYGCWFNKDIGKLIEESGLIVERVKRYHLGTTWEIVLRPNPELLSKTQDRSSNASTSTQADRPSKTSWFFSLWK